VDDINFPDPAFFIFKDITQLIKESLPIQRKLIDCYYQLKRSRKFLFLLSSSDTLPAKIKKFCELIPFDLPDREELSELLEQFVKRFKEKGVSVELSPADLDAFVSAASGLTYDEAYNAFMKVFVNSTRITPAEIDIIHHTKKELILKEGVLEYVTEKYSIAELGGLDRLKDWLKKRKKAFSQEARQFGLDRPKGVLTMGVTGCGKSLAVKTIAALWNLPLFRLDMNLVYSGISGVPEEVFSRALTTMDRVSPAILWIDEIESGISDKTTEGSGSRILGYFLTWMQEHTSEVFVAATANRIDLLPAELLRRGRFDQIFFIDLPSQKEREEIFYIHLKKRNNDPAQFNITQLALITKGWSGSEIEQAIISGMYEAFNEKRPLHEDDLLKIFSNTVPLSTTMEEQIKRIRSWAHNRAVRASSEKEY